MFPQLLGSQKDMGRDPPHLGLGRRGAACPTLGSPVRLLRAGGEEAAVAEAVDETFALVVRHPDGRRETVSSGEVSVRGLLGYV